MNNYFQDPSSPFFMILFIGLIIVCINSFWSALVEAKQATLRGSERVGDNTDEI